MWSGECAKMSTVLIQTLMPALVIVFGLFVAYGRYQHYLADNLWKINSDELRFDDPPQVLGAGSFGVVLKAHCKGVAGKLIVLLGFFTLIHVLQLQSSVLLPHRSAEKARAHCLDHVPKTKKEEGQTARSLGSAPNAATTISRTSARLLTLQSSCMLARAWAARPTRLQDHQSRLLLHCIGSPADFWDTLQQARRGKHCVGRPASSAEHVIRTSARLLAQSWSTTLSRSWLCKLLFPAFDHFSAFVLVLFMFSTSMHELPRAIYI